MLTGALIAVAAFVAGMLNTAGAGGAILSYLVLTGSGVAPLTAHATNQLITPLSFVGAARGVRYSGHQIALLITGCLGTVAGVAILSATSPAVFQAVAPWVILPAAVVVALQGRVKQRLGSLRRRHPAATLVVMLACGIYAGMVGVGTGTLMLVVLGMGAARAPLNRLLPSRNAFCFGMAVVVACAFATTGLVDWPLAALLAIPAVLGGLVGTRLVGRLPDPALRTGVVLTATGGALWLLL